MLNDNDIIAAISTPAGSGGLGVIRISGPGSHALLKRCFRSREDPAELPRQLVLGRVEDGDGRILDQALAGCFPSGCSYTGEEAAELHCHGGAGLLREILRLLLRLGARPAQRGEFTQRAFLNGRLDLAQAEAVLALIEARSADAARLAAAQLRGGLSQSLRGLSERLRGLLAEITVSIDFPEEQDAPTAQRLTAELNAIKAQLEDLLRHSERGIALRQGRAVAIIGPANAGKSSLFNALLARERAIVTAEPGATRDALEDGLDLDGLPLALWDTAGFRAGAQGEAERLGMERSRDAIEKAQLLLVMFDAAAPWDMEAGRLLAETSGRKRLILLNKIDIATPEQVDAIKNCLASLTPETPLLLSVKSGAGMDGLRTALSRELLAEAEAEPPLLGEARHQQALLQTQQAVEQAISTLAAALDAGGVDDGINIPFDLIAIDMENAIAPLAQITGENVGEDLLDEIFSRFCVGK